MEQSARHPHKALSAVRINSIKLPGRYGDGNGLYLIVDPSGAKRWVLRTVVSGRRRDIGLGGLRLVSLAEAREKAIEYRKLAREGGNPLEARRRANVTVPTFADAARSALAQHKGAWRNEKHASQWINTLTTYVFPVMGETRVDEVDTPDVLRALSPIWLAKPETASRVRQRISTVLDWAKAAGFRTGDNPAAGVGKGLPRQPDRKKHFVAIAYAKVPKFIIDLKAVSASEFALLAFELLILTATRTNEVLGARWTEVNFEQNVWTIPASRMKAGRDHRVPLTSRTVNLFSKARASSDGKDFVFPGRAAKAPMSNMVFLMILRRMGAQFTAHGFRSAFRDWASECTNFPREVCEMALAHSIRDKTEAAYRRGDLFDKRRELMQAWDRYISGDTVNV
jgi:integrase